MSDIQDISEAHTIPAMPTVPAASSQASGMPLDFGPLIDDSDNTDDFELTPMPPVLRPGQRRKRWLIILIACLVVLLVGGGIFTYISLSRPPAVQYTQAAASVGNLAVTVSGTGPVEPNAIYNLNFSASAPIQAIYVKVGDQVTAGQKLAKLDPTSLQDAVNQAQNNVNSAQTALNQAQTNLGNTQSQQATSLNIAYLNEQKALSACTSSNSGTTGGNGTAAAGTPTPTPTANATATATAVSNCKKLAQAQYAQAQQQANSSINQAQNGVTSAQQQLTNAQTALQTAKDNLNNATLVAPHAGVIEAVNGLVGETSGSGNSSGSSGSSSGSGSGSGSSSAFIVLVDASTLSINAAINEADIATVTINQPATFTVSAYPSDTFRASVASIDTMGSTSSNVVTYTVDLAVDMQSLNSTHIYPGMTATVDITTAERIGTLLVPSSALTFATTALTNGELTRSQLSSLGGSSSTTGSKSGSRGIVVELKAGKLVPVLVTTGLTNGQETEILSGLQEGDQVVVSQTGGTTTTSSSSSSGSGRNGGGFNGGNFGGSFSKGN